MPKRLFITDKEVCAICEISRFTLTRILGGFRRERPRDGERWINLADAKPEKIGGYRRWRVSALARVLGISVEEIEERLK